eukprot:6714996-Lingulodinium_polyedra.AAC.1
MPGPNTQPILDAERRAAPMGPRTWPQVRGPAPAPLMASMRKPTPRKPARGPLVSEPQHSCDNCRMGAVAGLQA